MIEIMLRNGGKEIAQADESRNFVAKNQQLSRQQTDSERSTAMG
jgi:hypothetical protein